jgi:hypothetical protein
MKHIVMSVLAIAAFGVTVAGTKTAEADKIVSSNWQPLETSGHVTTTTTAGSTVSITYNVGPFPPQIPNGVTRSGANTGGYHLGGTPSPAAQKDCVTTGNGAWNCPTAHIALEDCSNGDFLTGDWVYDFGGGGTSSTDATTGYGAGYWSGLWTPAGTDNGNCPNNQAIAGGAWIYVYQ